MSIRSGVWWLAGVVVFGASAFGANETLDRAQKMEDAGNSSGARTLLADAVQSSASDPELLTGYAEFLERSTIPARGRLSAARPPNGRNRIRRRKRPPLNAVPSCWICWRATGQLPRPIWWNTRLLAETT